MLIKKILTNINQIAVSQDIKVYIIGGIIRDLYLELKVKKSTEICSENLNSLDFDLVVDSRLNEFVEQIKLSNANLQVRYNPQFQTVNIKFEDTLDAETEIQIDIVQMRKESYPYYGSLPKTEHGTQLDDLKRRDFTINTLALALKDYLEFLDLDLENKIILLETKIIDLLNGVKDLETKTLRIFHDKSFLEDPTRLFRGLRYLHIIEGFFEKDTAMSFEKAMQDGAIKSISYDRRIQEVAKTLTSTINQNYFKDPLVITLYSQAFDINALKVTKIFDYINNLRAINPENDKPTVFVEFKKQLFKESQAINPKLLSALQFSKKVIKELS